MSEREGSTLSYSAQRIEELLRCPICLDRFNTPKLLPCQHTFCQSPCLEQLVDRFHRIKCPECREEHRVPYAGVSAFPTNRTILNFLDVPAQPRSSQNNSLSHNEAPQNATNGHNGVAAETQGQGQNGAGSPVGSQNSTNQNAEPQRTGCSSCGRQLALSRCAHCDNVVCDTCKRSHLDQVRIDINRLVSQVRRGMPNFSDAVSVIESKSEQLHQQAEGGKAEITDMIERYISDLRNRQRLLHSEIQMWLLGEIRSLRMLQENVEVELASTASFCDSTESTLARNQVIPDEDLVALKRQCVENMEVVRAYEGGQGVRLPRERQVQVTFEGSRLSQLISNFGEMSISEAESSGNDNSLNTVSDQPEYNSRSSSSRESSPAVFRAPPRNRPNNTRTSGANNSGNQPVSQDQSSSPSLDTALAAIGSNQARRAESMAGLMGGGGGATTEATPPSNRLNPRERMANLIGDASSSASQSPRTAVNHRQPAMERTAGLFGTGASSTESDSANSTPRPARRPIQSALSWELPVDFTHPPIENIRAGNGSHGNPRRSLAERRRHNLTDSQLLPNAGRGARRASERRNISNERPSRRNVNQSSHNSEPVPSTSSEDDDRPPLVRSRTYTREEFQTIREEDSVSRASTADPINRSREPVRLDVDMTESSDTSQGEEATYRVGVVDGGESTRVNVPRNNYQDKGRAIIRFGCRGSNNSEFIWPRGIAVSRSDQVFVADSSNHRVQVFDNIGTFVKSFGSYGQADGEFDCLAGIAMNTMGDILITDRYNHRVQVFDHQGSFKFVFGEEGTRDGQMNYPWGIACDSMGFIYVCDKENHRVQVFQSNGVFARKFGRLGRGCGQFENPHYLAISSDNKVYVSDSSNHRIQVFSMYGDFIFQFGSVGTMQGQMKYPKGIAIDEQGFVVVADSGNNRIQVFRGDGRFYCMFGTYGSDNGQFKGLEGLAILANGNVAVCDRENHRLQIF